MKRLFVIVLFLCLCLGEIQAVVCQDGRELLQRSLVGQQLPKFSIQKWVGKKTKMKGKFVLVDFWRIMGYPALRYTVPYQNDLAQKYKSHLQVVGCTCDDAVFVKWMIDPKIQYYSAIVSPWVFEEIFQIETWWPVSYLINPDGVVVWEGCVLKDMEDGRVTFALTEDMLKDFFEDYYKK